MKGVEVYLNNISDLLFMLKLRIMKKIIGLTLILVAISFSGCKKTKADCEENNYGVLKISYGLSTYKHIVIANSPISNQNKIKISAIGITSDTLHLPPATYTLNISSINANGEATDSQNGSAAITQCNETLTSVSF